jgi:uncharacterized protein (DUF1501 family)
MQDYLTTRRIFLQRGLTVLAATSTIPSFLHQTAMALADPLDTPRTQRVSGKDSRVLVVVQLSGGNDGLNTLIPHGDDEYYRVRPALAYRGDGVLKLNDYLGLNTGLAALKAMYDDGQLAVIQGVGYPNPNRSHFRSMDIWHTARPDQEVATNGWIGRYFDNTCKGCDPHVGVSIGETAPLAMQGEQVTPLSFERPEAYRYVGGDEEAYLALNGSSGPPLSDRRKGGQGEAQQLDFLQRTAMDAQVSSNSILAMTAQHRPAGEYPAGEFGQGLRSVAAMIGGGLSTRVYYVSLGGFDTHANQQGRHENLLGQLAQGVSAFWRDMAAQGNARRVLMMSFSEFGRRVAQNASGGTDHGAAAPMFLMGPSVRAGIVGDHPPLDDLDEGDLRYGIDFRSVYATVLQQWLDTPSRPILGEQFPMLKIVKG